MPAALIWLLLGLTLLALELLGAEFEGLLAAALACLVVSVLSGVLPLAPLLQVGAAVGLTAALLFSLQRWGRRGRSLPPVSSGERATVISGFSRSPEGRVLWQGQSWAATNLADAQPLEAGRTVTVLGREGTRLQVLPASEAAADQG
jgi:membrane protein implicated in regulation of membrane protease activity